MISTGPFQPQLRCDAVTPFLWHPPVTALLSVSDEKVSAAEEGTADSNMCGSLNLCG